MILHTIMAMFFGMQVLLAYMVIRMLRSDGWDKSNVTNALRVLSHIVAHPEDCARFWYVVDATAFSRPFWYIDADEFADIVQSRPPDGAD